MERREALKFFSVGTLSVLGGRSYSLESNNDPVEECLKHKKKEESTSPYPFLSSWQSNKISFYWKDPKTNKEHKHTYCIYCWLEKMVEAADELKVTKIVCN